LIVKVDLYNLKFNGKKIKDSNNSWAASGLGLAVPLNTNIIKNTTH